jgi:P27 family predicted phage terminase small subunit
MRGRKSAPAALKILSGEKNSRINRDEPPLLAGDLMPTRTLDATARAEWDRIVSELGQTGVLSRVDAALLTIYCVVYARWIKADENIKAKGLVIETDLGGVKPNPAVTIADRCESAMHRMLTEFGGTPAARTRIKTGGAEKKDRLGEFLDKRKRG